MGVLFMHTAPADDSNSLFWCTTCLLVEFAFPEAFLRIVALQTRNRDSSVPSSSLHHLDNVEYKTFSSNHHSIYLLCSKVVARMLADQVGLSHGKGVVTQTPPRPIHVHLHDLPIVPLLPSPGLIEETKYISGCNLLLPFPPFSCS